jgi:hypothetical protein
MPTCLLTGRLRGMLTGRLCGMLTGYTSVIMTSSFSGSVTWVGSSGIRVGSGHSGEEDACDAWRASVRVASHPDGA